MKRVCDVNLAFAILVEDHPHHPTAFAWWRKQDEEMVALTPLVQLGVLRLLSNARVMDEKPLAPKQALDVWQKFCHDGRTFHLQTDPELMQSYLVERTKGKKTAPHLWSDAWLAAAAESSAIGLTSFDSDFHQFNLSHFEHLVV